MSTKKTHFLTLSLALFLPILCSTAVDSAWQGTFFAVGENLYQLPYPFQGDGLPIRRLDRASQHSFMRPGAYDVGQTLSVTAEGTEYLIVIAESALVLYKDSPENDMLVYASAWLYPGNYLPRHLLKSVVLDEAFFVLSDEHLIERFQIDTDLHQLYVSSPVISEPTNTISTVAQTLSGDDVLVLVFQSNQFQFYSLLWQECMRSVSLAMYCDHVTALYNLPPVAGNGNISFIMNCDRDGLHLQYYVVVSYLTSDPLEVHQLDNVGVPVATSTHLAIRSGNRVTFYDRRHMSDGVPLSHSVTSQVQRIVGFEADNSSFFLIFEANKTLTQIDANLFVTRRAEGIRTLPYTLQGSCDSTCLPFAIINDGILVTVVGEVGYDIVTLTCSTDSSTLVEVARVGGIPEPPAFVEFIADLLTPMSPTSEPSTTRVQAITSEALIQTTTTPQETTKSMSVPEASVGLSPSEIGIVAACVFVAFVVLPLLVIITLLAVVKCTKKTKTQEIFVSPSSPLDRSTSAPTFNLHYPQPVPETGDVGINMDDIPRSLPETGDVGINMDDTWICPIEEESDPGYNSAKQTPQPDRLTVGDRHTESRQSTSSMGTMSLSTDVSSTGIEAIGVGETN